MTNTIDGLHAAIMNLACNLALCPTEATTVMAYTRGHRDARHAAAELASAVAAEAAPAAQGGGYARRVHQTLQRLQQGVARRRGSRGENEAAAEALRNFVKGYRTAIAAIRARLEAKP